MSANRRCPYRTKRALTDQKFCSLTGEPRMMVDPSIAHPIKDVYALQ